VSAGFSDIIAKGLQKKIPQRSAHAADMKRDLEEHLKPKCPVSQSLPSTWKVMQSPWQDVEMVDIKSGAPEFNEIVDLFYATCSRGEWRIVKIQRVQNLPQLLLYETHKRTIEARNRPHGANEKRLFHGTEKSTISKINRNAFNRSYCGQGVYFAVNASDSIGDTFSRPDQQGCKYMYLARVAVGEFCVGDPDMRVPLAQPGTDELLLYDTTVNRLGQPDMYVAYHDAQAYPEYLEVSHHDCPSVT